MQAAASQLKGNVLDKLDNEQNIRAHNVMPLQEFKT